MVATGHEKMVGVNAMCCNDEQSAEAPGCHSGMTHKTMQPPPPKKKQQYVTDMNHLGHQIRANHTWITSTGCNIVTNQPLRNTPPNGATGSVERVQGRGTVAYWNQGAEDCDCSCNLSIWWRTSPAYATPSQALFSSWRGSGVC